MLKKLGILLHHPEERQRALWITLGMGFYLVLPFDIIPDLIPILGFLDDVGLFIGSLIAIMRLCDRAARNDLAVRKQEV